MTTTQVASNVSTQVPFPTHNTLPTKEQLKAAYAALMEANREHTKRGLEFGRMCYELQQHHRRRGVEGQGFEPLLDRLNIKKTTAYRWIRKYKRHQLSATWHEVQSQRKRHKDMMISEGRNVHFEFHLPDNYSLDQWNADVKTLGGPNKVRKMFTDDFLPEVRKRAKAKEHLHRVSRRVQ